MHADSVLLLQDLERWWTKRLRERLCNKKSAKKVSFILEACSIVHQCSCFQTHIHRRGYFRGKGSMSVGERHTK
jgi:hypothetical protein